jgi:hypothetical protein
MVTETVLRAAYIFRMAVDLLMVAIWGIAAILILLATLAMRNWPVIGFLAVSSFIAFAFAVDFDRIAERAYLQKRTRRWLLLSVCFFAILLAAGGHALGSLGIDLHWRYQK